MSERPFPIQQNRLGGITLMISGSLMFLLLDSVAKHLGRNLPVLEVVWGRYVFHLLFIVILMRPRSLTSLFATRHPVKQVARSLLLLGATMSFFTALKYMPLADAAAIGFTWPLIVTALSVPLLGERVGLPRWAAVVAGFVGALIIIQPGAGLIHWATMMPLCMAVCYGLYQILTRMVGSDDGPVTSVFYTAVLGALAMTAVVPFLWQMPTPLQWLEMAAMGATGGFGHFLVIRSLQLAPASVLAPFAYTQLVFAMVLSWALFSDVPDTATVGGAAIVALAGLFVIYRERRAAQVEPTEV